MSRAVFLFILAAGLTGCDKLPEAIAGHRDPPTRYRLTTTVATPEGEASELRLALLSVKKSIASQPAFNVRQPCLVGFGRRSV